MRCEHNSNPPVGKNIPSATAAKKKLLLLLGIITGMAMIPVESNATHILGGNISYNYLGDVDGDGNHTYEITLVTYQDCNSPNWGTAFPSSTAGIAIYEAPLNVFGAPLHAFPAIGLHDSGLVDANIPDSCNFGFSNFCMYEVVYRGLIDLPFTPFGYHFVYDVCCRGFKLPQGNGPDNLLNPDDEGSIYHAWVGPTGTANSSPVFPRITQPYICVGEQITVNNSAVDNDGDSLFFEFIHPYDGEATTSTPSNGNFTYPINSQVTYAPGFNQNQPFGSGGIATIDPGTGISVYQGNNIGIYLITTQVTEVKNNQIVGVSSNEFQYLVTACNNQVAVDKNTTSPNDSLEYHIEAGDSLCIDVTFFDPDGDNLSMTMSGSAFSSSLSPPATFTPPVSGATNDTISSEVCWKTSCSQGRTSPYFVNPKVLDDGCPPLESGLPYRIYVEPYEGPTGINGQSPACPGPDFVYETDSLDGTTYHWTVINGTKVQDDSSHKITVQWNNTTSGEIRVQGFTQFGCTAPEISRTIPLTAISPPEAGPDTLLCSGDSVTLGGNPTANPNLIINWSPLTGLDTSNILNPTARPKTSTKYILTVSDTDGCFLKDSVQVLVDEDSLEAGPDLYLCPGDSIRLNAAGAATYNWTPGNVLTAPNAHNPVAFPTDTTEFILSGTTALGCVYRDTLFMEVDTVVPTHVPDRVRLCIGDTIDIGGNPTGPLFTTFQWTPNFSLSSDTIPNPRSTTTTDTTYFLEAFNGSCFGYDTVMVHVDSLPQVSAGAATSVCLNDSVQLSVTGDSLVSFQWSPENLLNFDTVQAPFARPRNSQFIKVRATNVNGCKNTDSVFVTVKPLPVTGLIPDTTMCFGDTIGLQANNGISYAWAPNENISDTTISNPIVFPPDTTIYTVDVEGANNCINRDTIAVNVAFLNIDKPSDTLICPGDTIQLNLTGGASYQWDPSPFLSGTAIPNPNAFPKNTTTFNVFVTDSNNCSGEDSILVEVSRFDFITPNPAPTICYDDSIRVTAQNMSNVTWTPANRISSTTAVDPFLFPRDTTTYIVNGLDPNRCQSSDTIQINVFPPPPLDAGADHNICRNDTVQLGSPGDPNLFYEWKPDSGLNSPFFAQPMATTNKRRQYILKVTDQRGCSLKDSVWVNVFKVTGSPDTNICSNESYQFNALPQYGETPFRYAWSPAENLSSPASPNPELVNPVSDIYRVVVEDANNCTDTTEFDLQVGVSPEAAFSQKLTPGCDNIFLELTNESNNYNELMWNVNGNTFTEENPELWLPYNSPLSIELVAISSDLCSDSTIKDNSIKVFDEYVSGLSTNVFSPNNDGINDWFEYPVENKLYPCTDIKIYTRWGELVFQSQGNTHSWDGTTFDGKEVPEGTYFYILTIKDYQWKGSLQLFR